MTPEERLQLSRFLQLLEQAKAGPKDATAEAMIREALTRQPDGAYLLVQRVIQLELAQQARQEEVERLTRQLAEARTSGLPSSFFGQNAFGRQPAAAAAPAAVPVAAQPQAAQSAWGSGLLGTVASTAMGVVAGSMIAQGIGSLMGQRNANPESANADLSPGGGTLVETDYGAQSAVSDAAGHTHDYGGGDSGDFGDIG